MSLELLLVGRLHPLLIHFPIGLLLLAALLETASAALRPLRPLRRATGFILLLGAVSAAVAAAAGLILGRAGGYEAALLASHRRLGIGVAVAAALAALLHHEAERRRSVGARRGYRLLLGAAVVLLLAAGYQGGLLAHGPAVPALAGLGSGAAGRSPIVNLDSARLYDDLVAPILARRCTSCHGPDRAEGGLRLHTAEALLEGGDDGPVLVAGEPEESDLLRRVTLPPGHEDAMPPNGPRPLEVGETELIRWWIATGASTTRRVGELDSIPTPVAVQLARVAGPRAPRRAGVYAIEAAPADARAVAALRQAGIEVEPIAEDLALLQVTAVNVRSAFDDERLRRLLPVAEQVTWLDLSGTRVSDAGLSTLARMPNLTRLSLANTAVGDSGVRHLAGLARLEHLNLYGTRVSDAGLDALRGLDGLRALYLWGTRVTPQGQASLQGSVPNLRVIGGAVPSADPPREGGGRGGVRPRP